MVSHKHALIRAAGLVEAPWHTKWDKEKKRRVQRWFTLCAAVILHLFQNKPARFWQPRQAHTQQQQQQQVSSSPSVKQIQRLMRLYIMGFCKITSIRWKIQAPNCKNMHLPVSGGCWLSLGESGQNWWGCCITSLLVITRKLLQLPIVCMEDSVTTGQLLTSGGKTWVKATQTILLKCERRVSVTFHTFQRCSSFCFQFVSHVCSFHCSWCLYSSQRAPCKL